MPRTRPPGWVRSVYYYHAVTLEWGDIGYNYLVDRYGNVYEGRYGGPGVVGGHVYGYNYGSAGIAVLGTHGNSSGSVSPTGPSLASLADLSAWEANRSYIHPLESEPWDAAAIPNLAGHRDYPPYATSCPGDDLYAALPDLRQSVWNRLTSHALPYEVGWLAWQELPAIVHPGWTYSLTVQVQNRGWLTWSAGSPNPVHIGYHWLDSGGQRVVQPPADDHRRRAGLRSHLWACARVCPGYGHHTGHARHVYPGLGYGSRRHRLVSRRECR